MRTFLLLALAFSSIASAQEGIYKDKFLKAASAGDLAMVTELVGSLAAAQRVLPLSRHGTQAFTHRNRCIVAIAHRDTSQAGLQTYVGIQIVKVFKDHRSPAAVFAMRNEGWFARDGGAPLAAIVNAEGAVNVKNMAEFAKANSSPTTLDLTVFTDRKRKLGSGWHARVGASLSSTYSGDEAYLPFWSIDPATDSAVPAEYAKLFDGTMPIRIENRLVRFLLTGGLSTKLMPSVEFDCNDPLIKMVAIREYMPFSSDTAWTYLTFR